MNIKIKLIAAAMSALTSVSLQAHEGHAALGSVAHEIEHAGWTAAALVVGSVVMLWVFSVAARLADKHVCKLYKDA